MSDTKVKTRSQELREILAEKSAEMDRQEATWKTEPDDNGVKADVVSTEQAESYRSLLAESKELQQLIKDAEDHEGIKSFMDAPVGQSISEIIAGLRGEQKTAPSFGGLPTVGAGFIATDECKAFIKSGGNLPQSWEVKGPRFAEGLIIPDEYKDVFTASVTSVTNPLGFGTVEHDPLVAYAKRMSRVRDLFPARPTTANMIQFFRVTGYTGAASVLAERVGGAFALKPGPAGLTFDEITAHVSTIAWYEAAHRHVLEDEPQLQAVIDVELLYGLRLHEDYQILQGSGTGSDLLGILNTPGVQSQAVGGANAPAAEQNADTIRRAATKAFLAYYEPTGVVVHPSDWEKIELIKDSQQRYIVAGSVAIGAQPQVWRMPVVQTPAIPQHTALLGAFGIAAQLYDREVSNIRIAEQHADFFLRNAIVVLAEERLALATKRPEAFVKVALAS